MTERKFVSCGGLGNLIITLKLLVAPSEGELLSLTVMVMVFVLGAAAAVLAQVKMPLVELMETFAGAEPIPNVNVQFGKMLLVAEFVTMSV